MSIFIPKKKEFWLEKPTSRRDLRSGVDASFVYQFYDEYADGIRSLGSLVGTQGFETGPGGIGLTGGAAAGDYFDTGNKEPGFGSDGLVTDIIVFSVSSSSQGLLFSMINTGTSFIDELWFNTSETQGNSAGKIMRFIRGADGPTRVLRAATEDIGINDGAAHVCVVSRISATAYIIAADGVEVSLTYNDADDVTIPAQTDFDYWVGTRNLRDTPSIGSADTNINLWARIPRCVSLDEAISLSEAPYQILEKRKTYFLLATGAAPVTTWANDEYYKTLLTGNTI